MPHYGKSFEAVREMSCYGEFGRQVRFIGAYVVTKLIGFINLVIDDSVDASRDDAHHLECILTRDKAPTNALVAQGSPLMCESKGIFVI